MAKKKSFHEMTDDELEALNQELMRQKAVIRLEQHKIHAVLTKRRAEQDARRQVARMSPAQRAAAAQIIQAEGIDSSEAIGEPGA